MAEAAADGKFDCAVILIEIKHCKKCLQPIILHQEGGHLHLDHACST